MDSTRVAEFLETHIIAQPNHNTAQRIIYSDVHIVSKICRKSIFFTHHFSGRKLDQFRVSFHLLASLKTVYQTT